jgi:Zn-dependent protease
MGNFDVIELGHRIFMFFPPFLFALCFHEYSHGLVAKWKGDRTADIMGRLTLNPLAHVDVLGTLILPLLAIAFGFPFFGWAKPVPINSRNLKHPDKDMFWISLAGPASNIFLAIVSGIFLLPAILLILGTKGTGGAFLEMLQIFVIINLFLAVFNLIPLHPLDGGKIFAIFFPRALNNWLEENQATMSWALVAIFMLGGFRFLAEPVQWGANLLLGTGIQLAQHFG